MLILLEVAAIVRRQSHSSFDRESLHEMRGITRFGLLAIIRFKWQKEKSVCICSKGKTGGTRATFAAASI